jgi:Txe/YoeB family toxin of Txe-Axe toxin-antitoxin module
MKPETLEELEAEKCYEKNIYTAKEAQDLIQELYETPFTIRVKATKK